MARDRIDVVPRSATWWPLALIAVATLTVSCSSAPPKQSAPTAAESMRSELGATDEILANAVYSQLNADPIYYFRHVDVRVDSGVADLSGSSGARMRSTQPGRSPATYRASRA